MTDPYTLFKKFTLPNGISVYHANWRGEKWQSLGFVVRVGARHDPEGKEGIAHFVEHLVSQSTSEDLDILKLELNDHGGGMNLGTTSHNNTTYTFSSPISGPYFQRVLNSFGEMLLGLKIFKKIERERRIILSEFHRTYSLQPSFKHGLKVRHHLYPGLWLERQISPIGRIETIDKITEEDLKFFYDKFYIPENISIISLGGLTSSQLRKNLLESPLSIIKSGQKTQRPKHTLPPAITTHRLETTFSKLYGKKLHSKTSEILFVTTLHGKYNLPTIRIAEDMLNVDLFNKIRQQHGLAYHVNIGRFRLMSFTEFSILLEGVKRGAEKKIEIIFENSLNELSKNEELFKRFRKKASNADLIPNHSPFVIRKGAMSDITFEGKITTQTKDRRESASVQFKDVVEIFELLKAENRLTSIITP